MRFLVSLLLVQLSQGVKIDHPIDISLIASQIDSPESLKKYEQLIKGHISRMNTELERSDDYAQKVLNPQINKLLTTYGEQPQYMHSMVENQQKINQTAKARVTIKKTANTTHLVQKEKNLTKGTLNIIEKDSHKVEDQLKAIESKFLREDSSSAIPMETEHFNDKKDSKKEDKKSKSATKAVAEEEDDDDQEEIEEKETDTKKDKSE